MGDFIREKQFADYGGALECRVEAIGGYEYLNDGRVCVTFVKRVKGEWVEDHSTIMAISVVKAIGLKLLEIAGTSETGPRLVAFDVANKLAS